jgi:hypothetical protein
MVHNIVYNANDPGYYSGPAYNLYVDRGNPIGVSSAVFIQHMDSWWWMKSILKTAGWQVTAWASGSSTGIYSDPFTSSSQTMVSDAGWWCLTHPISSRSFIIQKSTPASQSNEGFRTNYHSQYYRIKYSPGGFAISGSLSTTMVPGPQTGSQELCILGGGTDALPSFTSWSPTISENSNGSTAVFNCVAQTSGFYGFFAWISYGGKVYSSLGFDPIITLNKTDAEPYVLHCVSKDATGMANAGNGTGMQARVAASSKKWTWTLKDLPGEVSGAIVQGLSHYQFNTVNTTNNFAAGRPPGKVGMLLPLAYITTQSLVLTCSYKGISTLFKSTILSNPNYPPHDNGTYSVFSLWDCAQIHDGLVVPWFGVKNDAW